MGARPTAATLTENWGGPVPAGTRLYVGIDVGRRQHVVAAIGEDRMETGAWERAAARSFPTSGQGYRTLCAWLDSFNLDRNQVIVGCEPTGGWYARTVASWLERGGYQVAWLQNWALHDRRQLLIGKQTKTDALDARIIARLLYEREQLGLRRGFLHHPPQSSDALRLLVPNRLKLVEQRNRLRVQLTAVEDVLFPELKDFFKTTVSGSVARRVVEAFPTPKGLASASSAAVYQVVVIEGHARSLARRVSELQLLAAGSAGLIDDLDPILRTQEWLLSQLHLVDDQVNRIEAAISSTLEAWPDRDRAVLQSLPAMSTTRQAVLLASIGDLSSFKDDRQLRKLLGWYPQARESGSTLSKHRLGHSGNRLARREVWLWAMQLISSQHRPTAFRAYYRRLRSRGMTGHVAVGHLAGKLISVLYFCLRNGELYDPDRHARDLGDR